MMGLGCFTLTLTLSHQGRGDILKLSPIVAEGMFWRCGFGNPLVGLSDYVEDLDSVPNCVNYIKHGRLSV